MMVQGIVVVITASYVFVNTAVDLLYSVVDPRMRRTN
jgi:ABC-type dipeptide/oligopeptide/nickel transport system permease component